MVQKLTKRHNHVGEIRLDFSTVKHFLANLSCIWKGKLSAREFEGQELPRLEVFPLIRRRNETTMWCKGGSGCNVAEIVACAIKRAVLAVFKT